MLSASEADPPPKRIVVPYGFWLFLLSGIVMFSALFAAYAVLMPATAGGPSGVALFNTNAAADGAYGAADPVPRNPTTGIPGCCARHGKPHATTPAGRRTQKPELRVKVRRGRPVTHERTHIFARDFGAPRPPAVPPKDNPAGPI